MWYSLQIMDPIFNFIIPQIYTSYKNPTPMYSYIVIYIYIYIYIYQLKHIFRIKRNNMQTSQSEPVINFLYTIRMVHYNIQSNYLFGENLNISQSLISFFVYICYFLHFYLGRLWKLRYGGNRKLNGKRLSLPF